MSPYLPRCPEYDTLESNKHIVSGALHSCYWDGSWWQGCDSGGCSSNSWDSAGGQVCPGCSPIDTQAPFTVSHFQSPDQSNIWMSQNGNEASFDICYGNGDYLNTMSEYWEDGMVLAFSLWGEQSQSARRKFLSKPRLRVNIAQLDREGKGHFM